MLRRKVGWMCVAAALWGAPAAQGADRLVLPDGTEWTGTFEGYRGGRFFFLCDDGATQSVPPLGVVRLEIAARTRVQVDFTGSRRGVAAYLYGFENQRFRMDTGDGMTDHSVLRVTTVDMGMGRDLRRQREVELPAELSGATDGTNAGAAEAEAPKPVDPDALVKIGMVTLVHFDPVGEELPAQARMASVRMGNYLRGLESRHKGKLRVVTVPIESWEDPTVVAHRLQSLPQFWFYRRTGKLSAQLTERFTTQDIEDAFAAARR